MILSELQKDSLTELINISFSRSANSLSELTGDRVIVEVPKVELIPISDLTIILSQKISGEISTVHQIFNGTISGDALLILDKQSSILLAELLVGDEPSHSDNFSVSLKEVIVETGNILLNSCLSTFGNLLNVHITFSVPNLHLESLNGMLKSIVLDKSELQYAMVVFMQFKLKESLISGYIVIVLGITSLEIFINEVEKFK